MGCLYLVSVKVWVPTLDGGHESDITLKQRLDLIEKVMWVSDATVLGELKP